MRAPIRTPWTGRRMLAMGAAGAGLLAVLAGRAGITAPESRLGLVVLDVLVGLAFVATAWIGPGPIAERSLVLGVSCAWMNRFLPVGWLRSLRSAKTTTPGGTLGKGSRSGSRRLV